MLHASVGSTVCEHHPSSLPAPMNRTASSPRAASRQLAAGPAWFAETREPRGSHLHSSNSLHAFGACAFERKLTSPTASW